MSSAAFTSSGFNKITSLAFGTSTTAMFQNFSIGISSLTATITDTGLRSTISGWTSGTDFKALVSGYPVLDTTNQKITMRAFVTAAEATGYTIYEYCDLNNEATKIPAARFVWTDPITKTTANQLTIVTVYKRA